MSRITPLDPTERYKHVKTVVQVVFYQKTRVPRRKILWGTGTMIR